MNGNGIGNPVEMTLNALEGVVNESSSVSPILTQTPATAPDPFFDLPPPPQAPPKLRSPSRSEIKQYEAAADRAASARVSPALRRFGEIARLVPGAERVRVRKRLSTGQIGPIGEWSLRDIQTSGDLEAFLMQYVRPKWKGGDYYLAVIDGAGREHDAGLIPLPEPPSDISNGAGSDGHIELVRDLINKIEKNMQPQQTPDPLEQIRQAKAMVAELTNNQQTSSDAMLAMALAMAQPKQASTDPAIIQLLERLATKVEKLESSALGAAALPPPPAAPAQSFDLNALTNLLATVALPIVLKLMERNNDQNQLTIRDVIDLIERKRTDDDRFTARDAIALMRDLQSSMPQQSITDKMQELATLKELASSISGNNGPAQTTFWDALAALAQSKPLGTAIERIFSQEAEQRRLAAGPSVTVQPPAQRLPTATQSLPQPQTQPRRVVVPDEFKKHAERLASTFDEQALVLATIEALNDLRFHPQWASFINALLSGVAQNERERVLNGLKNWAELLVANGIFAPNLQQRIVSAFSTHWEAIQATVARLLGITPASGAPTAPQAAPQAPTAPTAPQAVRQPEESPNDEGDEGDDEDESS